MEIAQSALSPFCTGNQYTEKLANGEDPDEMLQNVAFHQGPHCLLRLTKEQSSGTEIHQNLETQPVTP